MSNSAGDSELLRTLWVEKWGAKRRCLTLTLSDGFPSAVPNNLSQKAASSKGLMYNVYSTAKRGRKPCLSGCQRKSPGSTNFLSTLLVVWLICTNFWMLFNSETSMDWKKWFNHNTSKKTYTAKKLFKSQQFNTWRNILFYFENSSC